MAELETGLPSTRRIQNLIKEKTDVELKLITQELLVGTIRWQDTDCLCIIDQYAQDTLVWRQAIAYLKLKS